MAINNSLNSYELQKESILSPLALDEKIALEQWNIPLNRFYGNYYKHDETYNTHHRSIGDITRWIIISMKPNTIVDIWSGSWINTLYDIYFTADRHVPKHIVACDGAEAAWLSYKNNLSWQQHESSAMHQINLQFLLWSFDTEEFKKTLDSTPQSRLVLLRWWAIWNVPAGIRKSLIKSLCSLLKKWDICLIDYFPIFEDSCYVDNSPNYKKKIFGCRSLLQKLFDSDTTIESIQKNAWIDATCDMYNYTNCDYEKKMMMIHWWISPACLSIDVSFDQLTNNVVKAITITPPSNRFSGTKHDQIYTILAGRKIYLHSHRFSDAEILDFTQDLDGVVSRIVSWENNRSKTLLIEKIS